MSGSNHSSRKISNQHSKDVQPINHSTVDEESADYSTTNDESLSTTSAVNRSNMPLTPQNILKMQKTVGNRAVQRMIANQRNNTAKLPASTTPTNQIAPAIQRMRVADIPAEEIEFEEEKWKRKDSKNRNEIMFFSPSGLNHISIVIPEYATDFDQFHLSMTYKIKGKNVNIHYIFKEVAGTWTYSNNLTIRDIQGQDPAIEEAYNRNWGVASRFGERFGLALAQGAAAAPANAAAASNSATAAGSNYSARGGGGGGGRGTWAGRGRGRGRGGFSLTQSRADFGEWRKKGATSNKSAAAGSPAAYTPATNPAAASGAGNASGAPFQSKIPTALDSERAYITKSIANAASGGSGGAPAVASVPFQPVVPLIPNLNPAPPSGSASLSGLANAGPNADMDAAAAVASPSASATANATPASILSGNDTDAAPNHPQPAPASTVSGSAGGGSAPAANPQLIVEKIAKADNIDLDQPSDPAFEEDIVARSEFADMPDLRHRAQEARRDQAASNASAAPADNTLAEPGKASVLTRGNFLRLVIALFIGYVLYRLAQSTSNKTN